MEHVSASFPPKKSLGQHFLTNPRVVGKIVDAAAITPGDTVIEIGPGTGVLTRGLLDAGARVVALEADARAVAALVETFGAEIRSGALELRHADVRDVDIPSSVAAGTPYTVAANIPYYLSGMLIRTVLTAAHQPRRVVFLVQKEVAERVARSRKSSLLSLSVAAYGTPRYVATVPKGNFAPPPKVDSAILAITDISRDRFTAHRLDESWFFAVLHAGFASRRKQLVGNLTALRPREVLTARFAELGLPADVRGEDLDIAAWCALARALA